MQITIHKKHKHIYKYIKQERIKSQLVNLFENCSEYYDTWSNNNKRRSHCSRATKYNVKASMSFGRLRERLENNHNVLIRVKRKIYQAIIMSTLLYGAETWTVYRRHVKKLHAFMVRHFAYGRPHHQEESPLDRTSFEDANWPPSETGSLLAATRRTTTTWPLIRHNQEKSKEKGYWYQLVEISGATARCMERHSKVVLEMKAVFVACDRQLWWWWWVRMTSIFLREGTPL